MSGADDRAETRFEVFEGVLAEAVSAGGTSPSVAAWLGAARAGLAEARAGRLGPRERNAADRIEAAFDAADGILARCLAPAQETGETAQRPETGLDKGPANETPKRRP